MKQPDPAKKLEKIRKLLKTSVRNEISFIIERTTMSMGDEIKVTPKTPTKKLILYATGNYGEMNKLYATVRLKGIEDPVLSDDVLEALSPFVEELFGSDDAMGKEVINYCQGKLYMAANILLHLGEKALAELANEWAMIGSN
jgi:hypothetical protein